MFFFLGMIVHAFNTSPWEGEVNLSEFKISFVSLHSEFQDCKEILSKTEQTNKNEICIIDRLMGLIKVNLLPKWIYALKSLRSFEIQ